MKKIVNMHPLLLFLGMISLTSVLFAVQIQVTVATTNEPDVIGKLVKGSMSGVYFVGSDGKRYVFQNEKVFHSWFADFSTVKTISDEKLATLVIGGNVNYRPGTRLVKIESDPKVYAVSSGGVLRWVSDEDVARQLFGGNWSKQVDDLPVTNFVDYRIGEPITESNDYNAENEMKNGSKIGGISIDELFPPTDVFLVNGVTPELVGSDPGSLIYIFYLVFSQPASGARLTIIEKNSKKIFYSEPIINTEATKGEKFLTLGTMVYGLRPGTEYLWKIIAYAAPNATSAQTAVKEGEFTTIDAEL